MTRARDQRASFLVAVLVERGMLGRVLDLHARRRLDALLVISRLVSTRILKKG